MRPKLTHEDQIIAIRYWTGEPTPQCETPPVGIFLTEPYQFDEAPYIPKSVPVKSFFMVKTHSRGETYSYRPDILVVSSLSQTHSGGSVYYSWIGDHVLIAFPDCSSYSEALRKLNIIPALVDP